MTDAGMVELSKDMFQNRFSEFARDLDELSQFALLIGRTAIGYASDIGCYLTDELDDPYTVWSGGLTQADTRLVVRELRTISRALTASEEDFGDHEEGGPDSHLVGEYVAATHAMVTILALIAYRRLHEEAGIAYENYAARLQPPSAPVGLDHRLLHRSLPALAPGG